VPYDAMAMAVHRQPRLFCFPNVRQTWPPAACRYGVSRWAREIIAMVLVRCDGCQGRSQVKFNALYVAWFNAEGGRVARKLRLCNACFNEHVLPFVDVIDPTERLHCPSCHIDTDSDYQAVYGELYMPGYEKETIEIPFCDSCRNIFVNWAGALGVALEDRRRADIGPTTHPSGLEVLRAMGIQPRVR
jgi:hypothetical protein